MTKKRKFYFTYSDNTEEEKYVIKKEFNEMLRDIFMKNGLLRIEMIFINFIIAFLIYISINIENTLYKYIIISGLIIIFLIYPFILYKKGNK